MACTEECRVKTEERNRLIEAWRAAWPNACPKCYGAGGKWWPSSFDYRAGVGDPGGWEPCSCLEEGRCPRCGLFPAFPEFEDDEHTPCAGCGWSLGDADQEPEPFECGCWYRDMMAREDALSQEEPY